MGSQPSAKPKLRKGLWSPEEDEKLVRYITKYGHKCWSIVPKQAGLQRCGKSCRLRWINYLRPDLKRGHFTQHEEELIIKLHSVLGNRWAQIATQLPGRTDNEIKNFWNSCLRKKLREIGIDPQTHKPVALNLGGIAGSHDDPGEVIELLVQNHQDENQSSNFRYCQLPRPPPPQQQQCGNDQLQCPDSTGFTLSMLPITLSPSAGQAAHPRSMSMSFAPATIGFHCHQAIDDDQTTFKPETSSPESVFSFWMENSSTSTSSTSTSSSGSGGNNSNRSSPSSCSESETWGCFTDGILSPTGTGSSILKSWGLLDSSMLETKIDIASWQQQQQQQQQQQHNNNKSLAHFYDEPTESDPISDVLDQM